MISRPVQLLFINSAVSSCHSELLSQILTSLGALQADIEADFGELLQRNKYDLIIVDTVAFEQAPRLLESIRALQPDVCIMIAVRDQLEALQLDYGSVAARTALAWMRIINDLWHHAIANVASSISIYVDILRTKLQKHALNQDVDELLAAIQRSSKLIRDWPKTPLFAYDTNLQINDFFRGLLRQLENNFRYRAVDFEFFSEVDDLVTIRMSDQLIRVVFDSLMDNAMKAMHQSNLRRITVSARQTEQLLEIAVTDTGCGIPGPIQPLLGRQVIVKGEGEEGLGMGIFLVQRILHAHHGQLVLGTTDHTGTTFFIRLPLDMSNGKKPDHDR